MPVRSRSECPLCQRVELSELLCPARRGGLLALARLTVERTGKLARGRGGWKFSQALGYTLSVFHIHFIFITLLPDSQIAPAK
jgi:hypothetical protein